MFEQSRFPPLITATLNKASYWRRGREMKRLCVIQQARYKHSLLLFNQEDFQQTRQKAARISGTKLLNFK